MATPALTSRRTEFEFLAEAGALHSPVYLVIHQPERADLSLDAHLLSLESDGVLLAAPPDEHLAHVATGSRVDVSLEYNGECYAFSVQLCGLESQEGVPGQVLRLSVPPRIDREQRRTDFRISLADIEPIQAQVWDTLKPQPRVNTILTNLSASGLGAIADWDPARQFHKNTPIRIEFKLPGEPELFTFIVRLVYSQSLSVDRTQFLTGWAFCPDDNPAVYQQNIRRLERFVAVREQTRLRHVSACDV